MKRRSQDQERQDEDHRRLILASSSPRRCRLLGLLNIPFDVRTPHVREKISPNEHPTAAAKRLSQIKARAVAREVTRGLIVAADTMVVFQKEILGKPETAQEATRMLHRLRSREHEVVSGYTVLDAASGRSIVEAVASKVWMRGYTNHEIEEYAASGAPMDKAGAYAIQDSQFNPVRRVEGCPVNVMGLPMCYLYRAMKRIGWTLPATPVADCHVDSGHRCAIQQIVFEED